MHEELHIEQQVALAPLTSMQVGGPARFFAAVHTRQCLQQAFWWANRQQRATYLLGGGSNVVFDDAGFDGLVIKLALPGVATQRTPPGVLLRCGAGVAWDSLVEQAVADNLAGMECLSGIPGSVGAAPVQNIGAYGQELSQILQNVHVIDRQSGQMHILPQAALGMRYRSSQFKQAWYQRFAIAQVDLMLVPQAPGCVEHAELQEYLGGRQASVAEVRHAVLNLRQSKWMLWQPEQATAATNTNLRSVGSFFTNPLLSRAEATRLAAQLGAEPPVFWQPDGQRGKISAAWLIEQAGFARGHIHAEGQVGLSDKHALCIINRQAARAADIIAFASLISQKVHALSGIQLTVEPDLVGFSQSALSALHVAR